MSGIYEELLTATIRQLEEQKAQGVKFVPVSRELLALLEQPKKPAQGARAAFVSAPAASNRQSGASEAANRLRETSAPHSASVPFTPARSIQNSPIDPPLGSCSSPPLSPEAKASAMAALRERALACVKCPHLASSRRNVAFGVGDINASLMFVGEAPGAEEDIQGEPFVGRAGQLLTRIIQTMGFSRDTVYIANILKCRPDTPGQAFGNRKPTPEEMKTCLPYLNEQIELIRPKVIVALGATAVEGLLGQAVSITRLRGTWREFQSIPLMPTFHPSFLLRPENAPRKREVWEDMLKVMERLHVPISDKQRGYFLRAEPGA